MNLVRACALLLLLLSISSYLSAQVPACTALVARDTATYRTFLRQQNATRASPCIAAIIDRLGRAQDVTAISVLVRYLDYIDPATAPWPDGGADVRPRYPAVDALFLIGKAASSELLLTIETSYKPLIQRHAITAFSSIYRDNLALGIRAAKAEQYGAASAYRRGRLQELISELSRECGGRVEQEVKNCQNALEQP